MRTHRRRRRLIAWSTFALTSCLGLSGPAMTATASIPNPYLLGVWCSGPHHCLAVGTSGAQFSAVWNGRSWKAAKVPGQGESLQALACVSWKLCMATGPLGVVDEWNGSAWRRLPTPNEAALESVSCPGQTTCVAVGHTAYDGKGTGAIVWNGRSWKATPVPKPPMAKRSDLLGVSCPSTTNCLAVGIYYAGHRTGLPMAASWNGSAWSLVAAPPVEMDGVSCVSKTWCMADGDNQAEFWNGSSWTPPPAHYSFFRGAITCLSTKFCASIGVTAITWTGSNWVYFGFLPGAFYGAAIWCGSSTDCTAVGTGPPNAAHWDGHKWHGHRT